MGFTKKSRAAAGSSGDVELATDDLLKKGNAVDAVIAGAFAACATSPNVLLGPIQILFGGAGVGFRAIDGRVRQPGLGAPRPRGFRDGDEVPDAARVGVPFLPAALAAALATAGSATLSMVMGPALALAKGQPRLDVLKKLAARGPAALEERPLASELLAVAGRPSGGLLTAEDLASAKPELFPATRHERNGMTVRTLPWAYVEDAAPMMPPLGASVASTRGAFAVDRHGTFALAIWDEAPDGIMVGELGFRAPFFAEPVRRGETRTKPGDARPAAAPMALLGEGPDMALAAFGAHDAYDLLRAAIHSFTEEDRIDANGEARLVALSHSSGTASLVR